MACLNTAFNLEILEGNHYLRLLNTQAHGERLKNPPLVIISHGFKGNKDYRPVMHITSEVLAQAGYAVLRYDAAGFGESEGASEDATITSQIQDLGSAIQYAQCLPVNPSRIGLVGMSLGSICAIKNGGDLSVKALALWSPPFRLGGLRERYSPFLEEAKEKGFFESRDRYTGASCRVGHQFMEDCRIMDLTDDVKRITTPTRILYGEKDDFIDDKLRRTPTGERYSDLITLAPTTTLIIPEADHDYNAEGTAQKVAHETKRWLDLFV